MDYDHGDLWAVRYDGREVVRRIFPVLQDANWHTRPWAIAHESIDVSSESFRATVVGHGTLMATGFKWTAVITGGPDGRIDYAWEGATTSAFLRNRLGLCLLLPLDGFAGLACTITHTDGHRTSSEFPDQIAPHQPFADIAAMEFTLGTAARIQFSGDAWEAEDHRNWADASYKVYCTPLALPRPVEVQPGDVVQQSITITWPHSPVAAAPLPTSPRIDVRSDPVALPRLGIVATPGEWSKAEIADIAGLGLDHLHAVVDLGGPSADRDLADAARHARATGCRLRVALRDGTTGDLDRLRPRVRELSDLVDCWYAFRSEEPVTSGAWISLVRDVLGADVPIGGGTDVYFTELNREPPEVDDLDWVNVPVTPQQHAFDDRSVWQNAAALTPMAHNLPRLAGGLPVSITPLTLRRRVNPYASDPLTDVSNSPLPASVDERQRTWFAGAWLAVALRDLSLPQTVEVVTCFEALGWRGVRERDSGSADPIHFTSTPGERYPAYDVLRALRGFPLMLPTVSTDRDAYDALVVTDGARVRVIAATTRDAEIDVRLTGAVTATLSLRPRALTIIDLPGDPS